MPRIAPTPELVGGQSGQPDSATSWHPERSPTGPVSIVVSAADRQAIVIRNGVVIGSAPIEIDGPVNRTSAFVLRSATPAGRNWLRIALPGQTVDPDAGPELRGRLRVPDAFRQAVESVLQPGATVVVTGDSLEAGATGQPLTVIEGE